jgi:hypothetical protein
MSTESTIAFYGVRFRVRPEEITSLEDRSHPLLIAARRNGLKSYWANFTPEGQNYLLFIGERLGILGFENDREVRLSVDEFAKRATDTDARLERAEITEGAVLWLQWRPDI